MKPARRYSTRRKCRGVGFPGVLRRNVVGVADGGRELWRNVRGDAELVARHHLRAYWLRDVCYAT